MVEQTTDTGYSLFKPVTIVAIREEIKNFKTFILECNLAYKAGQYLTLVYPDSNNEVRRSYSFVSSPELGEPLCIGVKRIENGFLSRRLTDLAKPGDQWLTTGAGGRFTLPDQLEGIQHLFFLAAGSGITPVFSLLKTLLHRHSFIKATLIYSNASPQKTIFYSQLQALQLQYQHRLQIEFLFSNNQDLGQARLNRDLLLLLLKKFISIPFQHVLFYLCGPNPYMRFCSYVLQEKGVPGSHIKKENFAIQRIRSFTAAPPDTSAHGVTLQFGNHQFKFIAKYPDTILQAAKKSGIQMPYSCEIGRCGSCAARCISGSVFHTYNEVLTDKELSEGLILTCIAHPIHGDVELIIE